MTHSLSLAHDWFSRPLPPNVVIGERSWLYSSFAFLHYRSARPCGLRIGRDTGLYHGTFFDLGPDGEVEIGDYCTIVGAIISSNSRVVINDYTFVAHEVVIADHFAATPPKNIEPFNEVPASTGPTQSIVLEKNVWVGARSVLLAGAHIGEGAIIGAATIVDFEVPPYSIVAGNPPRSVGKNTPQKHNSNLRKRS
jgi:acetyltransferase-like isoleucine patch superfamily enzyme